jgi:hypothetical protein
MLRTWRVTTLLVLGAAIIVPGVISGCASSGSSSSGASTAPPVQVSSPTPKGHVKIFNDGTTVSLYGSSGGNDGTVDVSLVVTAGRSGLDLQNTNAIQIQPVDENSTDPWSNAGAPMYNGLDSTPDLHPGQSVCIQQSFMTNDQPEPYSDLHGYMVTLAQPSGTPESATLTLDDINTDIKCA